MKLFKNTYFACRHGESLANVAGIIVSDPAVGTIRYGLSEAGKQQVRDRILQAKGFDASTLIVASDFKRTAETAEIISEALGAAPIIFDPRLRERFFGKWEGAEHANYSKAWKRDALDPDQVFNGAESTNTVRKRVWEAIQSLEETYTNRTIIIVSHGDPLMLLQTVFADIDARLHRTLPYYSTAELRCLNPCGLTATDQRMTLSN